MRKFSIKSKKGVSPIIATLLLIIIAVAAAVVTYSFVMGFLGTGTGTTAQQGQISIDTYSIDSSGNVIAYVRNTGPKAVNITTAYIDGISKTFTNGTAGPYLELPVGQVGAITITAGITDSNTHALKLVCSDNTQVEISIRKT